MLLSEKETGCWVWKPYKYPSFLFITSLLSTFYSLWFLKELWKTFFYLIKSSAHFGVRIPPAMMGFSGGLLNDLYQKWWGPRTRVDPDPCHHIPPRLSVLIYQTYRWDQKVLKVIQQWNSIFLRIWRSYLWAFQRIHCKYALVTQMSLDMFLRQSHQSPTF